jgi:hypothetical protein
MWVFDLAVAIAVVLAVNAPVRSLAVSLTVTDDAYTGNDPNRGPSATGDCNEATAFLEVRHHSAPRKKIGYIKYDISGVNPSLFTLATLSGDFATTTHDGPGLWNVYGLNDGEQNLDDVPDGSFGEANWTEANLSYDKGLGVSTSVPVEPDTDLGIDLTETTLLGTITIPGDAPFASNPMDLPLAAFLSSDTNGVVTFMITDANFSGTEWRIQAMENESGPGVQLNFVPEPGGIVLVALALLSLGIVARPQKKHAA